MKKKVGRKRCKKDKESQLSSFPDDMIVYPLPKSRQSTKKILTRRSAYKNKYYSYAPGIRKCKRKRFYSLCVYVGTISVSNNKSKKMCACPLF